MDELKEENAEIYCSHALRFFSRYEGENPDSRHSPKPGKVKASANPLYYEGISAFFGGYGRRRKLTRTFILSFSHPDGSDSYYNAILHFQHYNSYEDERVYYTKCPEDLSKRELEVLKAMALSEDIASYLSEIMQESGATPKRKRMS